MKSCCRVFCAFLSTVLFSAFPLYANASGARFCADVYKLDKKTGEAAEFLGFGYMEVYGNCAPGSTSTRSFENDKLKISYGNKTNRSPCLNYDCGLECGKKHKDDEDSIAYDKCLKKCISEFNNNKKVNSRTEFKICDKSGKKEVCKKIPIISHLKKYESVSVNDNKYNAEEFECFGEELKGGYAHCYMPKPPKAVSPEAVDAMYTSNCTIGLDEMKEKAEKGDKAAQYELGVMYHYPDSARKREYDKAVYWYKKAAEQGDERAKNFLKDLRDECENSQKKDEWCKNLD